MDVLALAITAVSALVYVTIAFMVYLRIHRLDIADVAWGGIFIVAAVVSYALGVAGMLQLVTTALVCIWGCRLSYHILVRLRRAPEDARYVAMRAGWKGRGQLNAYVRVFLAQGILGLVVALVVIVVNLSDVSSVSALTYLGIIVWSIGFIFESVGDAQLKKHLRNPRNRGVLMTTGLWRYTRHPNYFGEAVQWWGIWIIALGAPYGWLTVVSPLTITYLLLFVSGVPLAEKRLSERKGWDTYRRRTSPFLPLPPKKV